jgi:hypothetical protein
MTSLKRIMSGSWYTTSWVPKKGGLAPVQREAMDYEFDIVLDLDLNHNALTSKDRSVGIINFNQYG